MLDILQKEIKEWQTSRWEYTSRPSVSLWEGDSPENLQHFPDLYDAQEAFGYHTPFKLLHPQDIFISATKPCLPFFLSPSLSVFLFLYMSVFPPEWRHGENCLSHFHVRCSRADVSPVESAPCRFAHTPLLLFHHVPQDPARPYFKTYQSFDHLRFSRT